jgi:hypothetical protein
MGASNSQYGAWKGKKGGLVGLITLNLASMTCYSSRILSVTSTKVFKNFIAFSSSSRLMRCGDGFPFVGDFER